MKYTFVSFLIIALHFGCFAQQLDPFFKKNRSEYSVKTISDFYFQQESDAQKIVELAEKNSVVLKEQNYYLYLMNELTRATFIKHTGDIKRSLQLLETLKKDSFLQKNKRLRAFHNNVSGNVYFQMQSYSKANTYYVKAIALFKAIKDSSGWQGNLINAGNTHSLRNQSDSAFYYYDQALALDSMGIKTHHLALLTNLARLYNTLNEIDKATEMYEEVYTFSKANNDYRTQIVSSHNLGDCYLGLKRYDEAIFVLKEGKQTAIDKGIVDHLSNFDRTLSLCYAATENYDLAYASLFLFDSAQRQLNTKHLEEFAESLSLQHQKEIREKEAFIYRQKIKQEQSEQRLLLSYLGIATALIIGFLLLYLQKRKKNKILARQNFTLAQQHMERSKKKSVQKNVSPELIDRISQLLNEEKAFRDVDLTLEKFAKLLDTNRTYLSEHINAHFGCSFRAILNKFRIEEARYLLVSDSHKHYSIEGIATTVGYKNISSFNVAFKKETGITPSYFRGQNLKN